ncbi:glycoside hydrolase family 10 protein [Fontivita pretiosa]|uniref:glycoside hydrolase family 10 protein n=1 Tax=Fontivita pretiosa TaxID=2989684 RepID=UPI003D166153
MNQTAFACAAMLLAGAVVALGGCAARPKAEPTASEQPPPAPREFRAAWVATVANIDWPSRPGLSTEQQKQEITQILDTAADLKLNAIILQVRTSCDALYPSKLEPWSEYLTGTQGKPPRPYYDPLKFWIDQAHKRGIELHAWFNPYRARHAQAVGERSPRHVSRKQPQIVREFNGWQWLDPGDERAARHSLKVFFDVLERYAVDGIHIDDYFYPYPDYLKGADFPDEPTWQRYQQQGGKLSRADWRRQNIDRFIEKLYAGIRKRDRAALFGISPFGLGRPDRRPPGIEGFSQYDKLYADAELWLQQGWCDYFTPQLYWPIEQQKQSFPVLLDYWKTQNPLGRHLWPGMFTSKIDNTDKSWSVEQIINQIAIARQKLGEDAGHVHFSMKAMLENRRGLNDALKSGPYAQAALVPATPWLDSTPPRRPRARAARAADGAVRLQIQPALFHRAPFLWAVWMKQGDEWQFLTYPASKRSVELKPAAGRSITCLVVTGVDRRGNQSEPLTIRLP